MSGSTFTINGVECCASGDEIDLRAAGFLQTSIPPELLNHPQIKTILLCHENVPKFLESIFDNLGPQVSINVFIDNNNKSCEIKTNELGLIGLDVRCNALNVVGVITACKRKLWRLVLRNYECDALDGLDRTTVSDVEELVIASDDTLSVDTEYHDLFSDEESSPEISFQNITIKTPFDRLINLDTTPQCNTISLESMTNLQRFLLCAKGKKILPTGMDQLNNLQELFIFDDPIGDDFELSDKLKLQKVVLFNCGLKVLPFVITGMKELEVLELYHNNFQNQLLSLVKLVQLKRLVIWRCFLTAYPVGLENLTNLENLHLVGNSEVVQESFSIASLKNLKQLNMSHCELKKVPDGLENCINLVLLSLDGNRELGQQSFSIASLNNLKQLSMIDCNLKKVPDDLEKCVNLEIIFLDFNIELGQQSFSIASLKNLKKLGMSGCGLKKVPDGLNNCIGLINCDMRYNQLKELPEYVSNLIERGAHFDLFYNVLEQPPQVICDDSRSILNYLKSITKFGEAHCKRLRVLVIGNSGAGKTSLVNGLLMGEARPTSKDQRTEGIEIRKWYPNPENEDLELEIWDFGGHMEYQSVSHYFFEKHSLFLLAVDVSKYETTDESYDENAGKWIDELKSIVARPVIMVAATKSDFMEDSEVNDRCKHMLERINKQEKLDVDSINSDLENLDEKDNYNTCRKEKLNSLTAERPVLPKEIVFTSDYKQREAASGQTCIVVTSAGEIYRENLMVRNLGKELVRTGKCMNLFSHLKTTLPLLWVEIEKLLPTLRKEIKNLNQTNYLTFKELENWLCQHLEMFNESVVKKETLYDVILYLVKLGKVLHFEHVKQLKDFIFPDPQWLIMLVKEVVHHNLESHLQFKKEFKACNMNVGLFEKEKHDLVEKGLLSESLLRCIWFDAVPKLSDFKKLAPLLQNFDVGYKMTVKEAEFEGKEISKNYTFIPALMPEDSSGDIKKEWPTTALENEIEISTQYNVYSTFPVGLFERQMVRSHRYSDYRTHWKQGFFGIKMEEQEKVKFYVIKENDKIEFIARTSNSDKINGLWKVILTFHQIFADMVQELWPRLRYSIYNRCPGCRKFHYEMDFERLLKAPLSYKKEFYCEDLMDYVKKELIIPPPEVVEEFQKNKSPSSNTSRQSGASTSGRSEASTSAEESTSKDVSSQDICHLLNVAVLDGKKQSGIPELNVPPEISVVIPELRDVKTLLKSCEQYSTDILLLVADEEAFLSCFAFFHNAFMGYIKELGYLYFREIGGDVEKIVLSMVRCDREPADVGCAQNVVRTAVDVLKPKAVFSVGSCAGLQKDKAKLGDVVISRKLVICGNKKTVNDEAEWNYSRVDVSRNIGHLIRGAAHGWQPPLNDQETCDVKVHYDGEIVTGVDLTNSPKECNNLLHQFPEASAIDPQGQGVYLAAFDRGIEWVIIKGISHYADDSEHETKEWRRFSSLMAATVVNNILKEPVVLKDWPHPEGATQSHSER